jgi:plasmid maintenance system antidote protein VapI
MQDQYDLWHARKTVNLKQVKKLDVSAAEHSLAAENMN